MNTDDLKYAIRRRLFTEDFARGKAARSRFAAYFVTCPECGGRGHKCYQYSDRLTNREFYEFGECPRCGVDGFIDRPNGTSDDVTIDLEIQGR